MTSDQAHTHRVLPFVIALLIALAGLIALSASDAGAKSKGKGDKAKVAKALLPSKGKVFAGVSDTGQGSDFREYRDATGAHPAVMQSFESWGRRPSEALQRWKDTHTRGMLSRPHAR